MYKQNDEQTLMNTKVIPSEHDTKSSLHLCKKKHLGILHKVCFFDVTPQLNYFLLCHCQHILQFINKVHAIALSKVFYVMQHFKKVTVC